ncbi:MAG: glycosyltransferase [Bacteroidota bacterium]
MTDSTLVQPLISIIVPSYNQGKYIEATILSVLNQTYSNWELIIQDSCSNDQTERICVEYSTIDSRIRFYREKDQGFADGVNKGLVKAKGLIGAIQSSDDYYASAHVFADVISYFIQEPELTLVTSGFRMVDNRYHFIDIEPVKRKPGIVDSKDLFRLKDHFAQGSTFFKIARAKEIGGLNPEVDMVADTDFWVRMINLKPHPAKGALRVDGIWSHLIMHPEQRTADQSKFYMGRCKAYIGYLTNDSMDVPRELKELSVKGHLADTFQYHLFKQIPTASFEQLYRTSVGTDIPQRWKLKKHLTRIPIFHSIYFRNYMDNDTGFLLDKNRGDLALWFKIPEVPESRAY